VQINTFVVILIHFASLHAIKQYLTAVVNIGTHAAKEHINGDFKKSLQIKPSDGALQIE